jgi:small subunit ribosomal protein S6
MIFNTKNGEEGIQALAEKFKALIAENATVEKIEEWGKRRLAYPIMDELEGFYILVEFTSGPDFPAELDRVYKITDGVLRSMIIRKDEDDAVAAPAQAEPEAPAAAEEPAKPEEPVQEAAEEPAAESVEEPEAAPETAPEVSEKASDEPAADAE